MGEPYKRVSLLSTLLKQGPEKCKKLRWDPVTVRAIKANYRSAQHSLDKTIVSLGRCWFNNWRMRPPPYVILFIYVWAWCVARMRSVNGGVSRKEALRHDSKRAPIMAGQMHEWSDISIADNYYIYMPCLSLFLLFVSTRLVSFFHFRPRLRCTGICRGSLSRPYHRLVSLPLA